MDKQVINGMAVCLQRLDEIGRQMNAGVQDEVRQLLDVAGHKLLRATASIGKGWVCVWKRRGSTADLTSRQAVFCVVGRSISTINSGAMNGASIIAISRSLGRLGALKSPLVQRSPTK